MAGKPKFDPSQPFEAADATKPKFDPSQPFEAADTSAAPISRAPPTPLPPLPGSAEETEQRKNSKPISAADEGPLAGIKRAVRSVVEPAAAGLVGTGENLLSGVSGVAGSIANLVNAATGAKELAKQPGESDADFYRRTRAGTTYMPRTEAGQAIAASPIAQAPGKLVEATGKGVEQLTGSPAAGELSKDVLAVGTAAIPGLRREGVPATAEAAAPKLNAYENPVATARAFGDKVRPSDIAKTESETPVRITTEAERLAGSDELRKSLMAHNQKNATSKALADIGLPPTAPRVTPKLLDQARAAPLAKYREVGRAAGDFNAEHPEFTADLDAVANKEGLHPDSRTDISKMVDEYKGRQMSGPDAVKSISVLRREASRNLRADDPSRQDFGFAQRQVADAIEGQLTRQLGDSPLAQEFPAARQQLAKINDVDTATKAGQVDRHVLKKLRDRGAPLTGNLAILADTAEMFPHVTKHPQTISNVSGGGAVPGVGPVLDLASAGVRPLTRAFLKSDFYQNQLGKPTEVGPNSPLGDYFSGPAPKTPSSGGPTGGAGGIEVQEHQGPVVTLHPSTKSGFYQVAVNGKPSHIVDAAGADDLVKNLNAVKLNTPIEPPNNVGSIMKKKGQVTPFAEKRGPLLGDQFTNNASGESSASAEAISRVRQEKAAGQQRYRVNEDDSITPLTGVDAVDAAAKKGQLIVQRGVGANKYTILDRGGHTADAARAKLNRAQKILDEE